jgi:hypothetical protein
VKPNPKTLAIRISMIGEEAIGWNNPAILTVNFIGLRIKSCIWRKKMKKVIGILIAMVLLLLAVTVAGAAGHTSDQLANAGWDCIPAGPSLWIHCAPPSVDFPDDVGKGERATIQVKVFDDEDGAYLGTELLIREDLYLKGKSQGPRPCPQDGLEEYGTLAGYRTCHHFYTGHH